MGISVPQIRKNVQLFKDVGSTEISALLQSEYHEVRLFALLLMVNRFSKGDGVECETLYELYIHSTKYINNWDLVDTSASSIVGAWLWDKERQKLFEFVNSSSLWERRIAIISTAYFIKKNQFDDTFKIAAILIQDKEDLIHKAVGWMLREVGKRNRDAEELFLKKHYKNMPRTMLRYAIEKFEPEHRKLYLKGKI